jgi:hypothetical protein
MAKLEVPNWRLKARNERFLFLRKFFQRGSHSVSLKEVIQTINRMEADGVIERYAIGGAVGATFYLEPAATFDVDVFVEFHAEPGLTDRRWTRRAGTPPGRLGRVVTRPSDREIASQYVVIADWPVQFLPAGDALAKRVLAQAAQRDVEGTSTHVFTAEHIAAIALQTGRAKDKARILQFIEAGALDRQKFHEIITRHKLTGQWQRFERQFLKDTWATIGLFKVREIFAVSLPPARLPKNCARLIFFANAPWLSSAHLVRRRKPSHRLTERKSDSLEFHS